MKRRLWISTATLGALAWCTGWSNVATAWDEPAKVTYEDHIKPILREHCTSCHNANDKKSGLALDTYQAVMEGGSGGEIVVAGEIDSSRMYGLVAHQEQPFMPPNQDMIAQAKVDLIKTWIEQGMPENSGSEIKKAKANNMALKVTLGRPEGAPPMPTSLLKQTPLATDRAAAISALAASPWAPLVAVGGQKQVSLYHSETGALLGILPFPEGEPQSITFSRDGKLILVGGGRHSHSGYAALYDIATGDRITRVGDELDIVLSADINDNNSLIALAGPQKLVRVYDTLTGELKYEQKKHTDWIYSVRFSPDGLLLASADRSAGLVIWEAETGRLYLDLPGHKGEVRSLAWRPDSAALISASMDGTLKIWEMNEGNVLKSWDAHGGGALAVDVCNDGTMVSTGGDLKVKVWDINGNAAGEMPALAEVGHEVAITVDGKQIAAGDWAGNVRLWQRANPQDEKPIPANPQPLDAQLANAQSELQRITAELTLKQEDLVAKSSQLETTQKAITDLQNAIAMNSTEFDAATAELLVWTPKHQALKSESEALSKQRDALSTEIAPLQKLIALAAELSAKLEQERQTINAQPSADEQANLERNQRLESISGQIAIQTTASNLYKEQIQPNLLQSAELNAKLNALEPQLAEATSRMAALQKSIDTLGTNATQWKSDLDAKNQALPPIVEATNLAKQAVDAAEAQKATISARVEGLQADLQAFNSRAAELANLKATLEQTLAEKTNLVAATETEITQRQEEQANLASQLQSMEAQLKTLQNAMAELAQSKEAATANMAGKQQELAQVQSEISQIESDVSTVSARQELFLQAYATKPADTPKP